MATHRVVGSYVPARGAYNIISKTGEATEGREEGKGEGMGFE